MEDFQIRLGEHQRDAINETLITKDFNVEQIVLHPDYNIPAGLSNDIALLRLAEDVDLSVYTPVCLPDTDQDFTGQLASVAGWGVTENGGSSNILLELEGLEVLSDQECRLRDLLGLGSSAISDDMVCAGGDEGQNVCYGDSGGPLMVQEADTTFTLIGVVSWGEGCAWEGKPAVYAEVSSKLSDIVISV